ncbi:MAG: T9SS type A sorting domain-containing protein [Candidatus Marinimicrobia bacterium]|nr:T9SS type A sorting domain-containing protein [Candidatus Neomarinimicrobiota bacterium]MBL7022644.1 T9SS type A sorting domain-containing protein [Candidatus Neomarinimicrobiota bacterium]
MLKINQILLVILFLQIVFGNNFYSNLQKATPKPNNETDIHLIGIMVEFQEEVVDDLNTCGNGIFLTEYSEANERCDGYFVDRPPHNRLYFEAQLDAVANYYSSVSNENVSIGFHMIDSVYTLPKPLASYSPNSIQNENADSDSLLGKLFVDAVNLANLEIDTLITSQSLIVVFHAGIGEDFEYPFLDPAPYDIPSAYIDETMLEKINDKPVVNGIEINCGLLLPETQNHIYYDAIEDIFWNETDYCDYQVGLTGTFAFLLGYHFGLTPLFNTDTGEPGVGIFGLMDHGSNNGHGVIPAPPTAWTRIYNGWQEPEILQVENSDTINIIARDLEDKIYKIPITENEYFLIENRNNWIVNEKDIETLRSDNLISDEKLGHWFDTFIEYSDSISFSEDSVIIGFDNYDYGLPTSGLLIWHITEPNENDITNGVNKDPNNRKIHLEEADGAVDIGFTNYALFADPTVGWTWDMWYDNNSGYIDSNPTEDDVRFDNITRPNTRSNSGSSTYISLSDISSAGDTMSLIFSITSEFEVVNWGEAGQEIIGNGVYNGKGQIFYTRNDSLFSVYDSASTTMDKFIQEVSGDVFVLDSLGYFTTKLDTGNGFWWFGENGESHWFEDEPIHPMGYVQSVDNLEEIVGALSLGDIDGDGLDEIITRTTDFDIKVKNYNGTFTNGFPVEGDFSFHPPLIANILGDEKPEIICREDDDIVILSNAGQREMEIASVYSSAELSIVPNWRITENDTLVALVDGHRLLLFPQDSDHNYWLNQHSRPSNYPLVTGKHFEPSSQSSQNQIIAYNYPNPIMDGETTFRYYFGEASSVKITIYDATGFKVDELSQSGLTPHEYNEIRWNAEKFDSGLYFAEVNPNNGEAILVKVVVIR